MIIALLVSATLVGACRTPPARPAEGLTVATFNLMNQAADWPTRRGVIAAALDRLDADVIAFQEVLDVEGAERQTDWLATLEGSLVFDAMIVYEQKAPFGLALLSRCPIVTRDSVPLPSPEDDPRILQRVTIRTDAGPVTFANTHLSYKVDQADLRRRQCEEIVEALPAGTPTVLLGDFNATWDAPELAPLRARFSDAWAAAGGDPAAPTWNPDNPLTGNSTRPASRIDLILTDALAISPTSAAAFCNEADDDGTWPSDHIGVAVTVAVEDRR